jgi:hypothetical protein
MRERDRVRGNVQSLRWLATSPTPNPLPSREGEFNAKSHPDIIEITYC